MKTIHLTYYLLITSMLIFSACTNYLYEPMRVKEARLGAETQHYKELTKLPEPKEKIVAAVYKFRDQTGQYKESQTGASWSTAVTQGATSILLRAMEESGWFIPIEREGLSNLLNERKIIRSSRANYTDQKDQLLPPLIFAGIIIEGGIVSYDSNIKTGGAGVRYFGTGSSGEYREDRVTIYLRAVSTSTGRILKTIYTSKTILSQQIDVGVFRFVSLRRLLEAEMGYTYNEPGEMAVKEAIEKAVIGLIIEGIEESLWQLLDESELQSAVITEYKNERNENTNIDAFGINTQNRRATFGVGLNATARSYQGDYVKAKPFAGGELNLEYSSNSRFTLMSSIGAHEIGAKDAFTTTVGYADIGLKYKLLNYHITTPYLYVGAGTVKELKNDFDNDIKYWEYFYPHAKIELGIEHLITNKLGIQASVNYKHILTDNLDGLEVGKFDDFIWGVNVGITKYFSINKKPKEVKQKMGELREDNNNNLWSRIINEKSTKSNKQK
ncbi:CsgG/HfaB family protein [Marivirga arenosa]|uniref:CsgG/HfaB family protein n=1 Tax=Marivirga arenosa TaxID=3059076 RepID=A0AA49GFF1_9BACT|nr:CsgG/HfaB family protein [Marivirga sp. ABR2-2]WKK84400.2 CsgG/HfaB family protein [Marivirga sp. ABR2-2]